jgi:hypothetical protein
MNEPAFDPLEAIRTLDRHGVAFVLIGGLGARLHGSPSVTNDLDLCYRRTAENLDRLALALAELEAHLRGVPDDVPFRLDATTLAAGDHFTFTTSAGNLDILGAPAGVDGFEQLFRTAERLDLDGMSVLVASIEDLISMKRAAGRPKDLIEVEVLGALRDEVAERAREPGA